MSEEKVKWYNTKTKMRLSLLFPPLFIYGVYKTDTMTRKEKKVLLGIIIFFVVAVNLMDDGPITTGSVRQSQWDNSVDCVESYLKRHYLKDPSSYEGIKWSKVNKNSDGTYSVTHTYRAKNGFGGYAILTNTFVIAEDGWTVVNVY